jgi:hypothetical protein
MAANTGNIRLQVEGIDCWYVCSTDNGGGIFNIKDSTIGTVIGTYDSNTNTVAFTLESAPYVAGVTELGGLIPPIAGDIITGGTSGQTARVRYYSVGQMVLDTLSGALTVGETLTVTSGVGIGDTFTLDTLDGTVDINVQYGWDMLSGTGYIAIVK